MKTLWGREPTVIVAALLALISLGIAFGLKIDDGQKEAIRVAAIAVLALVARSQVSSPATVERIKAESMRPPPAPAVPPIVGGVLLALALLCGCSAAQNKAGVLAGISVEQAACILASAEMGQDEPAAIAAVCAIPPGFIQEIAGILLARKRAKAMVAAHDGGAP